VYASFADVSLSESTPTSSTYSDTSGEAPEYAMIGWSPYWKRIRGSVVRALPDVIRPEALAGNGGPPAMRALPERERLILHMRFVEDMTQSEIADRIGISQMHVSRLIRKALETMRDTAVAE